MPKTFVQRRLLTGWQNAFELDEYLTADDVSKLNQGMQADWRVYSDELNERLRDLAKQSDATGRPICPEPMQEGDEYRCRRCRIRWDIHEDKPDCRAAD